MNIYIAENIRRLRLEKSVTQERLAEHVGVTTSAVSKWERGEAYPDITLVLPLAEYFGVSADTLLGVDKARDEARIAEYIKECSRLGALGRYKEQFELSVNAYREFPNDWQVVYRYLGALNYDPNYEENPLRNEAHKDELYRLCARVLDECPLDDTRYRALSILSGLYMLDGEHDKAVVTAMRFPRYYETQEEEMEVLYESGSAEWWPLVRTNVRNHAEMLMVKIRDSALYGELEPRERIRILQKALDLLALVYDEGDYGFSFYHMCELHIWIANDYIRLKEYDTAFALLDKGLAYGRQYDELPLESTHTSYLVRGMVQDMTLTTSSTTMNEVTRELGYLRHEFYDDVRELDGFRAVIAKYEPFAGEKAHK
ncbi:MAG: helix-turn-helix domain-containing protein [Oscillospiraceae bacterium]|jgi:transcriptional regulator with XRE-family HTH domain|nr:helix-turn-helix domain-containing protein [Oscillospiraceae bacterium]